MKKSILWSFFILSSFIGSGQNKNIIECLELINFNLNGDQFYMNDGYPTIGVDTIINSKKDYLELRYLEQMLTQSIKFNNSDSTITLAVRGVNSGMTCSNNPFYFYEISKSGAGFKAITYDSITPSLNLNIFLKESKSVEIVKKYLPEINKNQLHKHTVEDVLTQLYEFNFFFSIENNNLEVTLSFCELMFDDIRLTDDEWKNIQEEFEAIKFYYDKEIKQFKILNNK